MMGAKNMIQLRKYFNKKGQGVVEYAVLLAFIVGLAVFLNGGGIGNGVQGVFDNMAAFLRGEDVQGKDQSGFVAWNKRGKNQLHNYETGEDLVPDADRIEADQQSLANIAEFFMGKTKAEVKAAIGSEGTNTQGTLLLDYRDWTEEAGNTNGEIKTGLNDNTKWSKPVDATNQRIYNWMQGDYGTNGYNSDYDYDAGTRYLVSNYMINPNEATPQGSDAKWIDNRSVRVVLTYDNATGTVKESRAYITRGERGTDNSGIKELDVKMSYDSNGKTTWHQTTEGKGYYKFDKNAKY